MPYRIIRIDRKDDELIAQSFDKYSDAYDLLEELFKSFMLFGCRLLRHNLLRYFGK